MQVSAVVFSPLQSTSCALPAFYDAVPRLGLVLLQRLSAPSLLCWRSLGKATARPTGFCSDVKSTLRSALEAPGAAFLHCLASVVSSSSEPSRAISLVRALALLLA